MIIKSKCVYGIMLVAFSIGLLVVLVGCPENGTSVDPIIGVWKGTWYGDDVVLSETIEYKEDGTFTNAMENDFSVTISGTYVHDSTTQTVTITVTSSTDEDICAVGYTHTSTYSLSADKNTLTVTASDGSGIFTRQ
jgi:hypothetical protein